MKICKETKDAKNLDIKTILNNHTKTLEELHDFGYIGEPDLKSFQFRGDDFLRLAKEYGKKIEYLVGYTEDYPYYGYFYINDFKLYALFTEEEKRNIDELLKKEVKIA